MCFIFSVLNTDNMSIVGVTIDYGPFGFMDAFDSGYICNGSGECVFLFNFVLYWTFTTIGHSFILDKGGRYAYDRQPIVCRWNLSKLSEALDPIVASALTEPLLDKYDDAFKRMFDNIMQRKV